MGEKKAAESTDINGHWTPKWIFSLQSTTCYHCNTIHDSIQSNNPEVFMRKPFISTFRCRETSEQKKLSM